MRDDEDDGRKSSKSCHKQPAPSSSSSGSRKRGHPSYHQEVEAARTTTTMENLAKKYLSGDEVVEVKLANNYWCYFSATLTILWSDLHVHVHVCIFNV